MRNVEPRIILGIDPGSRITGYGVIEVDARCKSRYVASGCIRLGSAPLSERLHKLHQALRQIITEYRVQEGVVEEVFVAKNVQSALKLGHARGVILLALAEAGCALHEYTPRRIKQTIVGYGGAEKGQMQAMVQQHLGLSGLPQQDAADALAAALCHVQHASVYDFS